MGARGGASAEDARRPKVADGLSRAGAAGRLEASRTRTSLRAPSNRILQERRPGFEQVLERRLPQPRRCQDAPRLANSALSLPFWFVGIGCKQAAEVADVPEDGEVSCAARGIFEVHESQLGPWQVHLAQQKRTQNEGPRAPRALSLRTWQSHTLEPGSLGPREPRHLFVCTQTVRSRI